MAVATCFRLALRTLHRNRLRSALALLGVTIGVAVVITMVAIGTGARMSIEQRVKAAGTNQIIVMAGNYMNIADDFGSDVIESGGGETADDGLGGLAGGSGTSPSPGSSVARTSRAESRGKNDDGWPGRGISPRLPGRGAAKTLTVHDADAIAHDIPGVSHCAPGVSETAVIRAADARLFGRLQGTDVNLTSIRVLTPTAGRFFAQAEIERREHVAVLSVAARDTLFGTGARAIGQTIQTRGRTLTVVGVVRVVSTPSGANALEEVFIPYTTLQDVLRITHLHSVLVSVETAGESSRVAQDIVRVLRARHKLGPSDPDDFMVKPQARDAVMGKGINPMLARAVMGSVVGLDKITLEEMARTLERSSRTMTALLASVAAVSLLVGGIGIMNIMLVSVTERTREIGLRRAVGACGRDVLIQFLAEAVTLSTIGGLIGILAGIAASGIVGRLFHWSIVISPASVVIAAGGAAAVGIFFGFYPARRAAQLDPIDALRYE